MCDIVGRHTSMTKESYSSAFQWLAASKSGANVHNNGPLSHCCLISEWRDEKRRCGSETFLNRAVLQYSEVISQSKAGELGGVTSIDVLVK